MDRTLLTRLRGSAAGRGPHVVPVILAGLVAAAIGVMGHLAHLLPGVQSDTVALRFQARAAHTPPELVVVAIDDVTFSDLGLQWPFRRLVHARAIDRLRQAGARTIVYDVQFTEPSSRPRDDLALFDAVRRAGNVVLATSEADDRGRTNVLGGAENLREAHARVGASNLPSGPGGVFERFTPTALGIPTLPVVGARVAGGPPLRPSDFEPGGAWIDYRGGPGTIRTVSFSDLVRGRVAGSVLRDKIVVVGASAPALQDVHATPAASRQLMSGPEIQANALWTALHRLPLRSVPLWVDLLAVIGLAMAPAIAGLRARPLAVALVAPLVGAAWLGAAQLAFNAGEVVAVVWPLAALLMGTTGTVAGRYLAELTERRRVTVYSELLEERVRERTEELRETQLEVVRRLAQAAESRDSDTGQHIERMSGLCERLARAVGLSVEEAELLRHAAALHDVGKIGIPDRVLLKSGRLDAEERALMNTHPTIGAAILRDARSELLQVAEVIARTHHERWDGSGYPAGLRGEEIPLPGRISTICDVYDALTSARPYKPAWGVDEALEEIRRLRGTQFDPALVDAFVALAPELRSAAQARGRAEGGSSAETIGAGRRH
jgi:CHASE2 domain-containing sensor protein